MAKNGPKGGGRKGAIKNRTQVRGSDGNWIKRDTGSGKFLDRKSDSKPFKGIRRER